MGGTRVMKRLEVEREVHSFMIPLTRMGFGAVPAAKA